MPTPWPAGAEHTGDALADCARLPRLQAALLAACQRAGDRGTRAALCVIEFGTGPRPGDAEPRPGAAVSVTPALRGDDVIASCPEGVVVVAGPFLHPADAEQYARRLADATHAEAPAIGVAIYPNHGDTPERLTANAMASLSRVRERPAGGAHPAGARRESGPSVCSAR